MIRKVLLIEPNYKNKYPPLGLMKLATYHRQLGDDVMFYKGEYKDFILEQLYASLIKLLYKNDNETEWYKYKPQIIKYISKGCSESLEFLTKKNESMLVLNNLQTYRKYFKTKEYLELEEFQWDRVCITTLFTFYWKKTVETINNFKQLCKSPEQVFVGGIIATVLNKELESATGIKCHKGLLDKAGILDNNEIIIDDLHLDYSILEEIDYVYPENNGYYGYMTRGCINNCKFCLVPTIEPKYQSYKNLSEHIKFTREKFGEKRNLLLLDNNVLASDRFNEIINEISECGFDTNSKYIEPNKFEIAIARIKENYNVQGYLKFLVKCFDNLKEKHKGEKQLEIHNKIMEYKLNSIEIITVENVFESYEYFKPLFESFYKSKPKVRYVDFNQGLEAKLLTKEKAEVLSTIPIKPLRVAFDHWSIRSVYEEAIRNSAEFGIKNMSNYILYNYKDKPVELYNRLRLNVELCEELEISIYSFPMKYHPITDPDYFSNRTYIGEHWNRKYIRCIQAILNSTKGKVGRGSSFFFEAFGANEEEFEKLLYMPEALIIYRFFYKEKGVTSEWWNKFNELTPEEMDIIKPIIHENIFTNLQLDDYPVKIQEVLKYYLIKREDAEAEM